MLYSPSFKTISGIFIALTINIKGEIMKKIFLIAALTSAVFSVSAKDINFGLEATYAPYEFYDDNNTLVGFDIDIANKICEELNYTCKFTNQSFDGLIPSIKTRRIDAAISGLDMTPERREQVDFTQSYYDNVAQFVGLKGSLESLDSISELNKKHVGVQNGTTLQKYLIDKYPEIDIVSYDSYQFAVLDLKAKRIDAILIDSAAATEWLNKEPSLVKIGKEVSDPDYIGAGLGIAVRKGNSALLDQFNQVLTKIKSDGTYDQIYAKWFK